VPRSSQDTSSVCLAVIRFIAKATGTGSIQSLTTSDRTIRKSCAIGRYGAFKYNNQDHSILMGLLAAENVADGATHDLWRINTDYGVYQEGAWQEVTPRGRRLNGSTKSPTGSSALRRSPKGD